MKMKNRDVTIDTLKGVSIILVVLGHVIQYIYAPNNYDDNWIFKVIYSFHMPLFFFVSGYLTGYKDTTIDWLIHRGARLVIPFVIWIPLDYVIGGGRSLSNLVVIFKRVFRDPSDGGLWFLWVLFLCCVLWFLIDNINKRTMKHIFTNSRRLSNIWLIMAEGVLLLFEIMILLLMWYMAGFTTVLGLRLCCKEMVFFGAGVYINRCIGVCKENKVFSWRYWKYIFVIGFPCMVIFGDRIHFTVFHSYLMTYFIDDSFIRIMVSAIEAVYFYLVSFVGIGFTWYIVKVTHLWYAEGWLKLVGKYTMEIYILHQYFFTNMCKNHIFNAVISFVLGIFMSLAIAIVFERQKIIAKILFGR